MTIANLLAKHGGAQSSATHIAFYSVDGYTTSLPLKEALAVDPILAWRMNGEVISNQHGYPLRVLIPGRYGEEQPKWLTRIELTDHFVTGLYASQGWYNGPLHTTSRIDYPHGQISANKEVEVSGIAFAGNRGIQKVEVSTDNASTWQTQLSNHPLTGCLGGLDLELAPHQHWQIYSGCTCDRRNWRGTDQCLTKNCP